MASDWSWTHSCSECGKSVEILNGDFIFSLELHRQSHKSLELVNKDSEGSLNNTQNKIENTSRLDMSYCNDCEENIEVINSDLRLSSQLHGQKHKVGTCSSGKMEGSNNEDRSKENTKPKSILTSTVEAIFHTMPESLKTHQGFISEKGSSKAVCNLCEITIESIFSITEHLKTKLHEDNIIHVLKALLPSELHEQMEFVSFYSSNLCCNLCGSKIDLWSNDLHKTIVNIFAHNAGRVHSSKKSSVSSQLEKADVVLRTLALMDSLVSENLNIIEHGMNPYYRCKLCDEKITYSENEMELLSDFQCHLNSIGHMKSLNAVSLLNKCKDLSNTGKEKHKFVVAKQNIYCIDCSCYVETDLEQLLAHVKRNSAPSVTNHFESVSGVQYTNPFIAQIEHPLSSERENIQQIGESMDQVGHCVPEKQLFSTVTKNPEKVKGEDVQAQLKKLFESNSKIKHNARYFENEEDGLICKLCKSVMKYGRGLQLFEKNILSHITGKNHSKKLLKEFNDMLDKAQCSSADILTNRKSLIMKDEKVWCTSCTCTIPSSGSVDTFINNLLLHLRGTRHIKRKENCHSSSSTGGNVQQNRESMNQVDYSFPAKQLPSIAKEVPEKVKVKLTKAQLKKIWKKNINLKRNASYLKNEEKGVKCKLCNIVMIYNNDLEHLKRNVMSHISGKAHNDNIVQEFNNILDKAQLKNADIEPNRKYLMKGKKVECTLCGCTLTLSNNYQLFIKDLLCHLRGAGHVNKQKIMTTVHQHSLS